jgi:mRNA interferase MazF
MYNEKAGLCVVCPVTGQAKGYPFEVVLPDGLPVKGVVLSDHVKSSDWRERGAEHIGHVPPGLLDQVRAKIKPLIGT